MPKLENFANRVEIDGIPYRKNEIKPVNGKEDNLSIHYSKFADPTEGPVTGLLQTAFFNWTDKDEVPYTSKATLLADLKNAIYSYQGINSANDRALGLIPGESLGRALGRNPAVGPTLEDVWDPGGILDYPTVGEAWEAVSSSTDDAAAGTGMRTLRVFYMDDTYTNKVEELTLNGTTPVAFIATDAFRHLLSEGITWGSTNENQGNITIRRVSGAEIRGQINFDASVVGDENGLNRSHDGHLTVPAGKTGLLVDVVTNTTKNHDVTVRIYVREFGETGFRMIAEMGNYQNSFQVPLNVTPVIFPEKSDTKMVARSNNEEVVVNIQMHFILIDN